MQDELSSERFSWRIEGALGVNTGLAVGQSQLLAAYRALRDRAGQAILQQIFIPGLCLLEHRGTDGGRDRERHTAQPGSQSSGLHILGEDLVDRVSAAEMVAAASTIMPAPCADVAGIARTDCDKFSHRLLRNAVGARKLHTFENQHVPAQAQQVVDELAGAARPNRADVEQSFAEG